MDEKELKQACLNLLDTADAVYLSTLGDDGFPHTRLSPAFARGCCKEGPFEFRL